MRIETRHHEPASCGRGDPVLHFTNYFMINIISNLSPFRVFINWITTLYLTVNLVMTNVQFLAFLVQLVIGNGITEP